MKLAVLAIQFICTILLYVFCHITEARFQDQIIGPYKSSNSEYQSKLQELLYSKESVGMPSTYIEGLSKEQFEYLQKVATYRVIISGNTVGVGAINDAKLKINFITKFALISCLISLLSFVYVLASHVSERRNEK
jgi:hypothetical protein